MGVKVSNDLPSQLPAFHVRLPSPRADEVGIVELPDDGRPSPVGSAARFLGLRVELAVHPRALMLIDQAVGERWPLIAGPPEAFAGPTGSFPASLTAFVRGGGTLYLDIPGHNLPEMKTHDLQPLRSDRNARHQFEKVNSSHHQAINQLGQGLKVESWCATDDIIEQVKLRDYPFALAVQYHPERGKIYDELFADFISRVRTLPRYKTKNVRDKSEFSSNTR